MFLGHSVTQRKNVSDATAEVIDEEIRRMVERARATAREILTERLEDLHKIAEALLEYETLCGEEIRALLRGEPVVRPESRSRRAVRAAAPRCRPADPRTGPRAACGQSRSRAPDAPLPCNQRDRARLGPFFHAIRARP